MAADRIHLVSGVTSGMGRAFAQQRLAAGEKVVGLVRNTDAARKLNLTDVIEVDFANPAQVETCLKSRPERWASFVNCAGILPAIPIEKSSAESLATIFNVNVISPMLICKQLVGTMVQGGCILLVGSISAQKGSFDDPYAATKGAIHSLVKTLALKFAPEVRVVGIAPGMTDGTRMTAELVPGRREHNIGLIPMARAGEAEEMAKIMGLLLQPECGFMTGAMVDVNGGQYVR
jgi:acetoacetyl-CoA reductase